MGRSSRLLGTAGHRGCRFGCLYCFTLQPGYQRCPRLDILRTRDLVDASLTSQVVQPACDTEFLLLPDWRDYLDELVSTEKIISFATKADIDGDDLQSLSEANKILVAGGKVLHIGVTLVRLRDWEDIEPGAPSPSARIASLRRLWEAGIATTVVMRPILPMVSTDEIDELVDRTYRFCHGYLSGPLYLTPAMEEYMRRRNQPFTVTERIATWQEGQPRLSIVERLDLEEHLRRAAEDKGRRSFDNNLEAAVYSNEFRKEEWTGDLKWSSKLRREPVGTIYSDPKSSAFCTIEEFIHPIGTQDVHIHVDSIYVGTMASEKYPEKRNRNEVTARDWFSLAQINQLPTFDNVPVIYRAILGAMEI